MSRHFDTGAQRNEDSEKLDYAGFLHPLVIQRFATYMHGHRKLEDGSLRASDNWTLGIPLDSTMSSGWRHFQDWWLEHKGYESREGLEDALCGLLFNVQSYLLTVLEEKEEKYELTEEAKESLEASNLLPYEKEKDPDILNTKEDSLMVPQELIASTNTVHKIGTVGWLKELVSKTVGNG